MKYLVPILFFGFSGLAANVKEIYSGADLSCALLTSGELKCWQMRLPRQQRADLEALDFKGRKVESASVGDSFLCAILDDKSVRCWGSNGRGELGIGEHKRTILPLATVLEGPPVAFAKGEAPVQVAAGIGSACARMKSGSVWCWGTENPTDPGTPWKLAFDDKALEISVGGHFGCGRFEKGGLRCWGTNHMGQMGNGDKYDRYRWESGVPVAPVLIGKDRTAMAVATGPYNACAVLDDGNVKCWGYNEIGILGVGDNVNRGRDEKLLGDNLAPIDLGTDVPVKNVSCGREHCCALFDVGGTAKCWGQNNLGQLGHDKRRIFGANPKDMGENLPFVQLPRRQVVEQIAAGGYHTCALFDDGTVACWGSGTGSDKPVSVRL